ncbi:MAG: hypothetical protein MUF45_09785 [Spirosomaceae bacterium]|nr:hypothetical protein [Spirosomataceae bacterium]
MKTINFLTKLNNTARLDVLKEELNQIGVNAFTIDYQNQQISIVGPDSIHTDSIGCAVQKAGFKCKCFRVCKHGES